MGIGIVRNPSLEVQRVVHHARQPKDGHAVDRLKGTLHKPEFKHRSPRLGLEFGVEWAIAQLEHLVAAQNVHPAHRNLDNPFTKTRPNDEIGLQTVISGREGEERWTGAGSTAIGYEVVLMGSGWVSNLILTAIMD